MDSLQQQLHPLAPSSIVAQHENKMEKVWLNEERKWKEKINQLRYSSCLHGD